MTDAQGKTSLARALREEGMSQRELALRAGVSRETICSLCTGRFKCDKLANLAAIAWALDMPIIAFEDLLARPRDLPLGPRADGQVIHHAVLYLNGKTGRLVERST